MFWRRRGARQLPASCPLDDPRRDAETARVLDWLEKEERHKREVAERAEADAKRDQADFRRRIVDDYNVRRRPSPFGRDGR